MGCAGGFCGTGSRTVRNAAATHAKDGACCAACSQAEQYKQAMRGAFNPWARNAGANPSGGSVDSTALDFYKGTGVDASGVQPGPLPGTQQQTADAGGYGVATAGINALSNIIQQQQRNDAATAAQNAQLAAQAAARSAMLSRSSQQADASQTPNASAAGGGSGGLMLAGLALVAAFASGLVKLPK